MSVRRGGAPPVTPRPEEAALPVKARAGRKSLGASGRKIQE